MSWLGKKAADVVTSGQQLVNGTVTAVKLAAGAVVAHLGYTPVNTAGDTMTGPLTVQNLIEIQGNGAASGYRNINLKNGTNNYWQLSGPRSDDGGTDANRFALFYNNGSWQGPYLAVDTAGRVKMPAQPAFSARKTTTWSVNAVVVFDTVDVNVGSYYNATNGRFTAPTAGTYMFAWHVSKANGTANSASGTLRKNGVTTGYQSFDQDGGQTYPETNYCFAIISMAANDYVEVYGSGTASGSTWNSFSGHLIG